MVFSPFKKRISSVCALYLAVLCAAPSRPIRSPWMMALWRVVRSCSSSFVPSAMVATVAPRSTSFPMLLT